MRRSLLCLAILLALPCAAHAEQSALALADDASANSGPVLDLRLDPAVAAEPALPAVTDADPAPPGLNLGRSFSVGVDIKTRREGNEAARAISDRPDSPTLSDKVESIVERSTFGVTGTYRF